MKPKFKIGEKVWIICSVEEVNRQCPYCDGFGHIDVKAKDGFKFETKCPICDGSGLVKTPVCDFGYTEPVEIDGYAYIKINGEISIRYSISCSWSGFTIQENHIFRTKREAEVAIKNFNYANIQKRVLEIKDTKSKD